MFFLLLLLILGLIGYYFFSWMGVLVSSTFVLWLFLIYFKRDGELAQLDKLRQSTENEEMPTKKGE